MKSERANNAREAYSKFLSVENAHSMSWNMTKEIFMRDVSVARRARLRLDGSDEEDRKRFLEYLVPYPFFRKILAAEIFPDRNPPEIIIAESELHNHDKLREENPSQEPRLSGEVIIVNEDLKFFMIDCFHVSVGSLLSPTKASYQEIANILIDRGYIPVDAMFELIPVTSNNNYQ